MSSCASTKKNTKPTNENVSIVSISKQTVQTIADGDYQLSNVYTYLMGNDIRFSYFETNKKNEELKQWGKAEDAYTTALLFFNFKNVKESKEKSIPVTERLESYLVLNPSKNFDPTVMFMEGYLEDTAKENSGMEYYAGTPFQMNDSQKQGENRFPSLVADELKSNQAADCMISFDISEFCATICSKEEADAWIFFRLREEGPVYAVNFTENLKAI